MKREKKTFLEKVLYNIKVSPAVKRGPVFPNKVALAIEVFLTPQKKHVKCSPKKKPAKATRFKDFFFNGSTFIKPLYIHKKALAIIILQKAIVIAGIVGSAFITKEVELTEIKANSKIKYKGICNLCGELA